jgi:hypothetical protein
MENLYGCQQVDHGRVILYPADPYGSASTSVVHCRDLVVGRQPYLAPLDSRWQLEWYRGIDVFCGRLNFERPFV